ncbi:FAD-dependent oxidoreductase [Pelomonas aquatica]|jgi:3-(3-hydroxy-phenyl)propionate hydroxylase|uniref:FAD-dependent oxidoreductase n=1 Tax=Pelomonas aquatica TaxID=431058 RepID=A0A9X4LI65_9BURK|nr:FAD-dependent oxidoreductase [Pelomonas aquatica]MCY4753214.1 FAD-dependent oxidoreductase [Pelomonas aquatica]MDG0861295.1 FAD-dependent oxidoreductase [Pelomonas aquatica]
MQLPSYPYHQSLEQRSGQPQRRPVVIVGAGPVGLTLALDLARRDVPVVVIDDSDHIGSGSRAVCWAKKTLEVFDRLGVGEPVAREGVRWQRGRVFHGEREAYGFDLLPEAGHKMPAMVNLQQDQVEARLVRAAQLEPRIELRGRHELIGLEQDEAGVTLNVRTPDGLFDMRADWVVACDGARSPTRTMLSLSFTGQVFEDRFLIADVRLAPGARPRGLDPARPERWFWFDPPFHPGQSVLLHAQADGLWRIDFQLGRDADVEAEKQPERIKARVSEMLDGAPFELAWSSIYQFACRRAERFRVGRVLLAGDAAHQVSPFGARGANSGVQDVDNLGWKLAAVLKGEGADAGLGLLDSYEFERIEAADDNIGHSTRATDFISPKSALSRRLRKAALDLAAHTAFAKPLVNSGRLSMPTEHVDSPLSTLDDQAWAGGPGPGCPAPDAPLEAGGWLSEALAGGFALLAFGWPVAVEGVKLITLPGEGLAATRYGARPGSLYLVRPDAIVAARWHAFDAAAVRAALARAHGRSE